LRGGRDFAANRRRPSADAIPFDATGILAAGTVEEVRRGTPNAEATR
jgi:hypothetical protein